MEMLSVMETRCKKLIELMMTEDIWVNKTFLCVSESRHSADAEQTTEQQQVLHNANRSKELCKPRK